MNEDFIPFELAKKLKEKGFMEKCIATYDIGDGEFDFNNYVLRVAYQMNVAAKDCLRLFNNTNTGLIDAPTISQVLEWLRKKKNIFVVVFIDDDSDCPVTYNIFKGADCIYHHHEEYFALSEWSKCEIAGIEYTLNNLI